MKRLFFLLLILLGLLLISTPTRALSCVQISLAEGFEHSDVVAEATILEQIDKDAKPEDRYVRIKVLESYKGDRLSGSVFNVYMQSSWSDEIVRNIDIGRSTTFFLNYDNDDERFEIPHCSYMRSLYAEFNDEDNPGRAYRSALIELRTQNEILENTQQLALENTGLENEIDNFRSNQKRIIAIVTVFGTVNIVAILYLLVGKRKSN